MCPKISSNLTYSPSVLQPSTPQRHRDSESHTFALGDPRYALFESAARCIFEYAGMHVLPSSSSDQTAAPQRRRDSESHTVDAGITRDAPKWSPKLTSLAVDETAAHVARLPPVPPHAGVPLGAPQAHPLTKFRRHSQEARGHDIENPPQDHVAIDIEALPQSTAGSTSTTYILVGIGVLVAIILVGGLLYQFRSGTAESRGGIRIPDKSFKKRCAEGHELYPTRNRIGTRRCDKCRQSIPKGKTMWRCRICSVMIATLCGACKDRTPSRSARHQYKRRTTKSSGMTTTQKVLAFAIPAAALAVGAYAMSGNKSEKGPDTDDGTTPFGSADYAEHYGTTPWKYARTTGTQTFGPESKKQHLARNSAARLARGNAGRNPAKLKAADIFV